MADIAAEFEEGGLTRTLKDLFAGAAGGIAQVLLGKCICSVLSSYLPFNCSSHIWSRALFKDPNLTISGHTQKGILRRYHGSVCNSISKVLSVMRSQDPCS